MNEEFYTSKTADSRRSTSKMKMETTCGVSN